MRLGGLTDPTDPQFIKYMKDRLGNSRLDALKNAPALADLVKRVHAEPGVKKWLDKRPSNEESKF